MSAASPATPQDPIDQPQAQQNPMILPWYGNIRFWKQYQRTQNSMNSWLPFCTDRGPYRTIPWQFLQENFDISPASSSAANFSPSVSVSSDASLEQLASGNGADAISSSHALAPGSTTDGSTNNLNQLISPSAHIYYHDSSASNQSQNLFFDHSVLAQWVGKLLSPIYWLQSVLTAIPIIQDVARWLMLSLQKGPSWLDSCLLMIFPVMFHIGLDWPWLWVLFSLFSLNWLSDPFEKVSTWFISSLAAVVSATMFISVCDCMPVGIFYVGADIISMLFLWHEATVNLRSRRSIGPPSKFNQIFASEWTAFVVTCLFANRSHLFGWNVMTIQQQQHFSRDHVLLFIVSAYCTAFLGIYAFYRAIQFAMNAFDSFLYLFGFEFPEAPCVRITDVQIDSFSVSWSCSVPVRLSQMVRVVRFLSFSEKQKQTPQSMGEVPEVDEYRLELDGCFVGATRETAAIISDLQPGKSYRLRVFALFGRNWTPSSPIYVRTLHFSASNQRRRSLGVSSTLDIGSKTDGHVISINSQSKDWHKKLVDEKELDCLQAEFDLSSRQRAEVQALVDTGQAEFQQKMDEINSELAKLRHNETEDVMCQRQKQRKSLKVLEDQRRDLDQKKSQLQSELDRNQQLLVDLKQELQEKHDDIEFCKNERNRIMQQLIDDETHFESCQSQIKSDIERLEKFHTDTKVVLENKRKETAVLIKEVEMKQLEINRIQEQNSLLESEVVKHQTITQDRLTCIKDMETDKSRLQNEITSLKYKMEEQKRTKARILLGMHSAVIPSVRSRGISDASKEDPSKFLSVKALSSKQMLMEYADESFEDILGAAHKLLESEFDEEEETNARPPQVFFGNQTTAYQPSTSYNVAANSYFADYSASNAHALPSPTYATTDYYNDFSASAVPTTAMSKFTGSNYYDNTNYSMNLSSSANNYWNHWPQTEETHALAGHDASGDIPPTGLPATLPVTNKMLNQYTKGNNHQKYARTSNSATAPNPGRRQNKKNRSHINEHAPVAMWLDNKTMQP